MKQTIIFIIISCMLTSCATIINQRTVFVTVRTTKPSVIIHGNDSLKTRRNKVMLNVERSREPLVLTTISDSVKNQIVVNSRSSFAYYSNIINTLGIGLWVDRNNPKRYDYPMTVRIDPTDTSVKVYKKIKPRKKGNLLLHVSIPYINSFYFQPDNESKKINTGFWGLTLGLDYYHRNNQYFNISAGAVTDFFLPVLGAVDIEGPIETISSTYVSVSHHHNLNRFSFGYGISYGNNSWEYHYAGPLKPTSMTKYSAYRSLNAFGLIFPAYYRFGRNFHLGVIYRPTFVRMNSDRTIAYEHLISIDCAWKMRIKK